MWQTCAGAGGVNKISMALPSNRCLQCVGRGSQLGSSNKPLLRADRPSGVGEASLTREGVL